LDETQLLTQDDWIIKDRLARKANFPMSEHQWKKKMLVMGLKIDQLIPNS
jgi:hypothetical protein